MTHTHTHTHTNLYSQTQAQTQSPPYSKVHCMHNKTQQHSLLHLPENTKPQCKHIPPGHIHEHTLPLFNHGSIVISYISPHGHRQTNYHSILVTLSLSTLVRLTWDRTQRNNNAERVQPFAPTSTFTHKHKHIHTHTHTHTRTQYNNPITGPNANCACHFHLLIFHTSNIPCMLTLGAPIRSSSFQLSTPIQLVCSYSHTQLKDSI